MTVEDSLQIGWSALDGICRGEFGLPLQGVLAQQDDALNFKRVGRLMAVWVKHPFAQPFPYDPDLQSNWAKSQRAWEIHGPVDPTVINAHRLQFELLAAFAHEWERPTEFLAEFNIFHSLCRRLRPAICGEAKALENAEKIAKDLQKAGTNIALLTPNQLLGATAVTVASYLVQALPFLSPHAPIVTGASLLAVCLGHRIFCARLAEFEKSYKLDMDAFARRTFAVCGSLATSDGLPCGNRVRTNGTRCWIHC